LKVKFLGSCKLAKNKETSENRPIGLNINLEGTSVTNNINGTTNMHGGTYCFNPNVGTV